MNILVTEPHRIYYEPHIYSSFPDITKDLEGNYLCVFRIGDSHHPQESAIMLSKSSDGVVWETDYFAAANFEKEGYVFNCPRINTNQGRLCVICDTKTSTTESKSRWDMMAWWNLGNGWSIPRNIDINGMVPDQFVQLKNKIVMGYHVRERIDLIATGSGNRTRFAQMMAESYDNGETWRDRTTVAISDLHDFCEGSIVRFDDSKLLCFLRDNKLQNLRSHLVISVDNGKSWSKSHALDFSGHRIVANVKQKEPYAGAIIGTFRNTSNKTLSMFVHNIHKNKLKVMPLDTETNFDMFNYGYSGWVENDDGTIQVVYYIQRDKPNPEIVTVQVKFD